MAFKLNNADQMVVLGEFFYTDYPSIWESKAEELVYQGVCKTLEDAKEMCKNWTFTLELYYEKGCGAFAVETEAVESGTIYSPYTAELGDEADE